MDEFTAIQEKQGKIQELLEVKGRTYRLRSGLTIESTIQALKSVIKEAVRLGFTKQEAEEAIRTGYNNAI